MPTNDDQLEGDLVTEYANRGEPIEMDRDTATVLDQMTKAGKGALDCMRRENNSLETATLVFEESRFLLKKRGSSRV